MYETATTHMSAPRKRPPKEELNRLYWFEEMGLVKLAEHYGVRATSVHRWMIRYQIPRRPMARRLNGQCREQGCLEPTCRVKRWTKSGPKWYRTSRCARHYHEWVRAIDKRYYLKMRKGPRLRNYPPRPWKKRLSIIAGD